MANEPKQIAGIAVSEVVGWKEAEDKKHILVGIKDGAGGDFALAVTPDDAIKVVMSLLSAVGQSQNQRGQGTQEMISFQPEWFEIGKVRGSDALALSLYMPDKSALSFRLPKAMAERLLEVLGTALGITSIAPPPGTIQH